jgi:hypothetical protein
MTMRKCCDGLLESGRYKRITKLVTFEQVVCLFAKVSDCRPLVISMPKL